MDTPLPFPTESQLSQDLLRLYRGLLEQARTRIGADTIFDIPRRVETLEARTVGLPPCLWELLAAKTVSWTEEGRLGMGNGQVVHFNAFEMLELYRYLRATANGRTDLDDVKDSFDFVIQSAPPPGAPSPGSIGRVPAANP